LYVKNDFVKCVSCSDAFHRVDHAAKRLGASCSESFARAAERRLDALEDDATTEAISVPSPAFHG